MSRVSNGLAVSVVMAIVLLSSTGCAAGPPPLSKEEATSLLQTANAFSEARTQRVPTHGYPGGCAYMPANTGRDALRAMGLLSYEPDPPFWRTCSVVFTPAGQQASRSWQKLPDNGGWLVPWATQKFVSVTAVSMDQGSPTATVSFIGEWQPNEFGRQIGALAEQFRGTARFRRFDDGWHLEDVAPSDN